MDIFEFGVIIAAMYFIYKKLSREGNVDIEMKDNK